MSRSEVVMVILARGGSKGIPGKNLRTVSDKSLLHWSIGAAVASGSIDRIIVSSDCPKIIKEAVRLGGKHMTEVLLSADDSTSEDALLKCWQH